jgi:hypothetical protein
VRNRHFSPACVHGIAGGSMKTNGGSGGWRSGGVALCGSVNAAAASRRNYAIAGTRRHPVAWRHHRVRRRNAGGMVLADGNHVRESMRKWLK